MTNLATLQSHNESLLNNETEIEIIFLEVESFISNSIDVYVDRVSKNLHPDKNDVHLDLIDFDYIENSGCFVVNVTIDVSEKGKVIKTYDFNSIETNRPHLTLKEVENAICLRHGDITVAKELFNELKNIELSDEEVIGELENCLKHKKIVNKKTTELGEKYSFLKKGFEYVGGLLGKGLDYKWKNLLT